MLMRPNANFLAIALMFALLPAFAQHEHHQPNPSPIAGLEPQPLLAQALRLKEALLYLGSSLSPADAKRLEDLRNKPLNAESINAIQQILDPYCLATVAINPEARVKVTRGS